MRKSRVLVLMHDGKAPPDPLPKKVDDNAPWRMESDVLAALRRLQHDVHPVVVSDQVAPIRDAIGAWQPHIVFNLLMHFHYVTLYDAHIVSYLELLKTPYTGSNPRGLLLASDKVLAKKILTWHRIRTPRFAEFKLRQRFRKPARLRYPLIVKSAAEHASIGIAQASIVHDDASLADRVEFVQRSVGTDAIAEEYIAGRELTVGVLGNSRPQVFDVWEMTFDSLPDRSAPIATSRVKWDRKYQERIGMRTGPARDLTDAQQREIARLARRIYRALELSGFARIDLRMNADGEIFVLEANPNPDLCATEDFAQSAARAGIAYEPLLQKIVNLGLAYRPAWKTGLV